MNSYLDVLITDTVHGKCNCSTLSSTGEWYVYLHLAIIKYNNQAAQDSLIIIIFLRTSVSAVPIEASIPAMAAVCTIYTAIVRLIYVNHR